MAGPLRRAARVARWAATGQLRPRVAEELAAERESLIASVRDPKGGSKGGEAAKTPAYFETGRDHCLDNTGAQHAHHFEETE